MYEETISRILKNQKEFFNQGQTKNINFRVEQLKKLKKSIIDNENEIIKALELDLGKPYFQAYSSEIYLCLEEINKTIKNIYRWNNPSKIKIPWYLFPSSSFVTYEPLGIILIISPWNYPFLLTLLPLIGAIAAGNCIIIKPSETAVNSYRVLKNLIKRTFDSSYINIFDVNKEEINILLEQKFDYIFFTGNQRVAKTIMKAASNNLTPLTLELGGASPCIVDSNISVDISAKRIVIGKFINAGQNCTSPNHVFVDNKIKGQFIEKLKYYIQKFYGNDPINNEEYSKIINEHHFDRLINLLKINKPIMGGKSSKENLKIEPTLIELNQNSMNHELIEEEIFGPILPIIPYENINSIISYIRTQPKPLYIYCFSQNKTFINKISKGTSSGNFGINNVLYGVSNLNLPFGGVGASGFGRYHSQSTFLTFSNSKSVSQSNFIDLPFWYPPYKKRIFTFIKMILNWNSK